MCEGGIIVMLLTVGAGYGGVDFCRVELAPPLPHAASPPIHPVHRRCFLDRLDQAKIHEARNLLGFDSPLPPGSSPAASLGASQRAIIARRATRRVLTEFGFLLSRRVAN